MHSTWKSWLSLARYYRYGPNRSYCSSRNGNTSSYSLKKSGAGDKAESSISHYNETYKQLDKLDFMTAAKILFSETPRKKKFGIIVHLLDTVLHTFHVDFDHLMENSQARLPSAVYLVAQYARYEIRRMEAELEQKKQEEEEKKLKEMESEAGEADQSDSGKELADMKVRLNKLEVTVKEIFVETKKRPEADPPERHEDAAKKDKPEGSSSDSPKVASSPRHDRKTDTENGKPSQANKS